MSPLPSNIAPEISHLPPQRAGDPKPRLPSKRKRDSICGLGTFTKPFTIRPCSESSYDKPHTFKPIRIVARSQLPLSFFDTATDQILVPNRLFSASIDVLERFQNVNGQEGTQSQHIQTPKVLIARHETKKTLYAMERVQERVYSLCKLAVWLEERDVADLWDPENLQAYPIFPKKEPHVESVDAWWKYAAVVTLPAEKPAKHARLSMLRPEYLSTLVKSQRISEHIEAPMNEKLQAQVIPIETQPVVMETPALPTPHEQLHNLVDQYLDAMYISKTSLAYFAKGPIARIRNAFTSAEEGAPATHELVTFMRCMLLSHKAEEKKYKEKLPEVIKDFPPRSFSDDDLADVPTKPKKSRKKVKPNRDGMYPQETEIVKKWWFGGMSTAEMARDETVDQRIRRRLGDLRVRDALLQMILILEITALESLATYEAPPEGLDAAAEESLAVSQAVGESQSKPKRKKKMDDVNLLLDLLLDKLCIWQSIEQEGVLDFDAKKQDEGLDGSAGKDRLQSFCVEVIIPFYMHRLPEQARMVNKKLGGPAPSSPPKRKAMRPPTVSRKSGEPKEPESKKSRRSLGRVATDTTGRVGSTRAPSLNRSATDSMIANGIKREGSEVPLSAIPFQRSPSNAARQSASHFKLLKGREMDLNTTSKAAAARAKQRKRVEEDLQEAISALKKPNRGLAAGSYADDIERRGFGSLGSTSRSRKPTNTVRKVTKDVQVTATPSARRRTKDMVQQTPIHRENPFVRPRESDAPPSNDFCIPSSAARPTSSVVPATVQRSGTVRTLAPQGVAETPSKPQGSRKFSIPAPTGRKIFTTPSKTRMVHMPLDSPPQAVEVTPTKVIIPSPFNNENNDKLTLPPRTLFATPLKKAVPAQVAESPLPVLSHIKEPAVEQNNDVHTIPPRTLFATPLKKAASAQVAGSPLPALSKPTEPADEPSIYDALGWNDDDDFI